MASRHQAAGRPAVTNGNITLATASGVWGSRRELKYGLCSKNETKRGVVWVPGLAGRRSCYQVVFEFCPVLNIVPRAFLILIIMQPWHRNNWPTPVFSRLQFRAAEWGLGGGHRGTARVQAGPRVTPVQGRAPPPASVSPPV